MWSREQIYTCRPWLGWYLVWRTDIYMSFMVRRYVVWRTDIYMSFMVRMVCGLENRYIHVVHG